MSAKASYTESELATYMVGRLDSVAGVLGLTTASTSILSAVTAVERLLGVLDVATLTDMPVLEAAATWQAWEAALTAASGKFDVKAGTADVKLSEMFKQIQARLAASEAAYYAAVAASAAAAGTSSFFAFGTACGGRGR